MRLLLARHGNTFNAGETPVRVGAKEDLPLTDTGEAQAQALGDAMKTAGIRPDRFICGPLQRTRRHTAIIMACLGADEECQIDTRLTEIDYGTWGGLSDAEIVKRFGPQAEQELRSWEEYSTMPSATGRWSPTVPEIQNNLRALVQELETNLTHDETAFLCSSNGILRFFLDLTEGGLSTHQTAGRAKMATGAASMLDITDGNARVLFWNVRAGDALPGNF